MTRYFSTKQWRARNPDKWKAQSARYYLKHKKEINSKHKLYRERGGSLRREYGITIEQYNQIMVQQNSVCAICHNKETAKLGGVTKKLSVDHCHKTKEVRGLLCTRCNRGIGCFLDDITRLKNAIKYLS